nr:unnamed protein product [Callosobruchus chinensis]
MHLFKTEQYALNRLTNEVLPEQCVERAPHKEDQRCYNAEYVVTLFGLFTILHIIFMFRPQNVSRPKKKVEQRDKDTDDIQTLIESSAFRSPTSFSNNMRGRKLAQVLISVTDIEVVMVPWDNIGSLSDSLDYFHTRQ